MKKGFLEIVGIWGSIVGGAIALFTIMTGIPSIPHLLGVSHAPENTPFLQDSSFSLALKVMTLFVVQLVCWVVYYVLLSFIHKRIFDSKHFYLLISSSTLPETPRGAIVSIILAIMFGLGWSFVFGIIWWGENPGNDDILFISLFSVWSLFMSIGVVWSAFRCES